MRLLNATQMRELDRRTIAEIGIPGVVLMENAGRAATEVLLRQWHTLVPGPVLVLAGRGNNGGDGYVIARQLVLAGWRVRTLVLGRKEDVGGDARINLDVLLNLEGECRFISSETELQAELQRVDPALAVDALLGTGLNSAVVGLYRSAIEWLNRQPFPVMAVDIPSGLDADSGQPLGLAVKATVTVSFACAKIGQCVTPGVDYCGDLQVVDIGIPMQLLDEEPKAQLLTAGLAQQLLPPRPQTGHKGSFGHLLLFAGSDGMGGAAQLAARGALRSGVGLLTVACPASVQAQLAGTLVEAMTLPLPMTREDTTDSHLRLLQAAAEGKQVLALGPGLGTKAGTRQLVFDLLRTIDLPLVLDADALNALAQDPDRLLQRRSSALVLTPHPGEMARLLDCTVADVEKNRLTLACDFAVRMKVVLLLKGARTIIAAPDGRLWVNRSGNPLLASGGSGDVLTGLIGGLLAQGLDPFAAAGLGAYLHGAAADLLHSRFGHAGGLASEIADCLPCARQVILKGEN